MAALTLADVDTPEKVADRFAAGMKEGEQAEALALLTNAHGAQTAREIWVHGSHLADQLGVW